MLGESRSPLGNTGDRLSRWGWVWYLLVVVPVGLQLRGSSQVGDIASYVRKMLGSGDDAAVTQWL